MPRGRHAGEQIPSVSVVILHIIEETAAHTGHLEIARELLDGATGLGMRLRALRSEGHEGCAMSAGTVPLVRELVTSLLQRARLQAGGPELRGLAWRMGVI